jgi:membrane protein
LRFIKVLWASLRDFFRDDGMTLAGSMSYFTMMAFVPFCLFMITLFGQLLGKYPEFFSFFLNRLISLFPEATSGISQEIMKLISYKGLGKFSLILYGFLSYQFFGSIERSLNVIFKVKKQRNFFLSLLMSVVMVTFVIIIVMASFVTASAMPLLFEIRSYLPDIKIGKITGFVISFVLPFIMVFFTVALIYKLLPMTRVKLSNAVRGAVFTTAFLEAAKYVFTWYVITIGQFGRIYGSLTAFIVFLLWMFYSSCIFLIGAEIVHNLDKTGKGAR